MNLQTVANLIEADYTGIAPALLSNEVKQFSIDSRTIEAGEVFFALAQPDYRNNGFNGDFADAHEFVSTAFERGALAAVVRVDKLAEHAFLENFRDRLLIVRDGIEALQKLAAGVYQAWAKPVVGITGSAGKTTAKELTNAVLKASGRKVLSNIKNYNNGIGHPLTVLRLLYEEPSDVAVLEMGMSTPLHEIERLCRITPPDVAVELNVLPVHLEHLGTIEQIQKAKAELVENMKPSGTAVLNADDFRVLQMRDKAKGSRILTYAVENQADVVAKEIEARRFGETNFLLVTPHGQAAVNLQLVGKHNVANALAAAAVGLCFDISPTEIAAALSSVAPPPMRGEVLHFAEGFDVINDSYNSNPDALLSMVETLIENGAHATRQIIVAGEMLELGEQAAQRHFETGQKIAEIVGSKETILIGVRGLGQHLIDGAKSNGLQNVQFFADSEIAANELAEQIKAGDLMLVKGSRGVRMERIIEGLATRYSKIET